MESIASKAYELEPGGEDDILATLIPVKDILVLARFGTNILTEVGRIFASYAAMAKPTGNHERAGGGLIAHAKVFMYCVVTDERRSTSLRRMPGVCAAEGIDCIDLRALLSTESGMAAWKSTLPNRAIRFGVLTSACAISRDVAMLFDVLVIRVFEGCPDTSAAPVHC